jgi:ferredoxin-NADP reductase
MTDLQLTVTDIRAETPSISCFRLESAAGAALPGFAAGAHITLAIPDVGPRKYSLVYAAPHDPDIDAPTSYDIAVRLETSGGGGSRFLHAMAIGDTLQVSPPQNNFALKADPAPVALVAGGIGVTPMLTMAARLKGEGRPLRMAYAARSRSDLAFHRELQRLVGADLTVHLDDVAGGFFDIAAYFQTLPDETRVYMCGPKPMLKAGLDATKKRGWPRDRLTFELFYSVASAAS